MNYKLIKKVLKEVAVLIAASLMMISLFACEGKVGTKLEYSSISIEQDINTGNDNKIKIMEDVINPTEIKETKKYVEETTKSVETTETASTQSVEEMVAELNSLLISNKKTGTDANGHPYLQKGQEYTFKDNGMGEPVEAPRGLKRTAVNPNTGVKYSYLDDPDCRWFVDTREEDEEIARLKMQKGYVGGTNGDLVKGRKLTEEEARQIAKMFSDSFK